MIDYEDVFNMSYWRATHAVKEGIGFFDSFYDRFLNSSHDVEEKFKSTNMKTQKQMLKESLLNMSSFFVTKVADDYLQKISRIHSKSDRGIEPYLYDLWLECLIKTVRDYDPEFQRDVELAWRLVMTPGIVYMKFQYDREKSNNGRV